MKHSCVHPGLTAALSEIPFFVGKPWGQTWAISGLSIYNQITNQWDQLHYCYELWQQCTMLMWIYNTFFACTTALYWLGQPLPCRALEVSPLAAYAMWWIGQNTMVLHSTVEGDQCRHPSPLAWSLVFSSLMFCCFQREKESIRVFIPLPSHSSPLWLSQPSPCAQQPPAVLPSLFPKVPPSQSVLPLFLSSFGPFHFLSSPPLVSSLSTPQTPSWQLSAFHIPHPCSC